jgi:ankyrin repeat protein
MVGCFCFREVLEAFSAPTPLPACKRPEPQPIISNPIDPFPSKEQQPPTPTTPHLEDFLAEELVKAVLSGEIEKIEVLIKVGADPALRTRGGDTALATAAASGRHEIFALLLASAAGIHARNESRLDLHFSN